VFRPLCNLTGDSPKEFREQDIVSMLEAYYKLLSDSLRQSYAPPESLVEACMNGYDAQFMFLMR